MPDEKNDFLSEAVRDAKLLKEAAVETAKNELIEGMVPKMKELLEKAINNKFGSRKEDVDRLRRGVQDNWPGESHTGFEEGKKGEDEMEYDEKDKDMEESLDSFFPQLEGEEFDLGQEDDMEEDFSVDEKKGKSCGDDLEDDEADLEFETVEISDEALQRVYNEALQAEAKVKSGFSDMTPSGELDELNPSAGLADVKSGEHTWDKETPPAKQDFTVKEMVQRGIAENKALRKKLVEANKVIKYLGTKLHEVNLFNTKVLHVNRLLTKNPSLTKEGKVRVMETIDKAKSISQVKLTYEAIQTSLKTLGGPVNESNKRKPRADAQKVRRSGSPDQKVLRESVDREENEGFARMRELAGLVNGS